MVIINHLPCQISEDYQDPSQIIYFRLRNLVIETVAIMVKVTRTMVINILGFPLVAY